MLGTSTYQIISLKGIRKISYLLSQNQIISLKGITYPFFLVNHNNISCVIIGKDSDPTAPFSLTKTTTKLNAFYYHVSTNKKISAFYHLVFTNKKVFNKNYFSSETLQQLIHHRKQLNISQQFIHYRKHLNNFSTTYFSALIFTSVNTPTKISAYKDEIAIPKSQPSGTTVGIDHFNADWLVYFDILESIVRFNYQNLTFVDLYNLRK